MGERDHDPAVDDLCPGRRLTIVGTPVERLCIPGVGTTFESFPIAG